MPGGCAIVDLYQNLPENGKIAPSDSETESESDSDKKWPLTVTSFAPGPANYKYSKFKLIASIKQKAIPCAFYEPFISLSKYRTSNK